jgi:hypothetical protein
MAHQNHFMIRTEFSKPVTLNIEPEGAHFPLGSGEEVSVTEMFTTAPVTVILNHTDKGDPIFSIWPGGGNVRVEKDGLDLLDQVHEGALI